MALSTCAARRFRSCFPSPVGTATTRNLYNQYGSTLVESLVAVSLFGLTVAAIGDLMTREIQSERANGTTTTAVCLAESELEDLHAQGYDAIASRSSFKTVAGATYTVQTTVVADTPEQAMKSVTTEVTWADARGLQSYSVDAIYGNPRIGDIGHND